MEAPPKKGTVVQSYGGMDLMWEIDPDGWVRLNLPSPTMTVRFPALQAAGLAAAILRQARLELSDLPPFRG